MDLTPRLLTEVEFREQWRGYSPNDVDAFLERVAAAVGELQERLRAADERASQAERRLLEHRDGDEISRTLVLAQRTAVSAVEEAQADAERILEDAQRRADEQMAEAEARLAALEADIAERTRIELGQLADRRAALQADVDALAAFQETHRARLRAELERQLAELDAPAAPDAPLAVPVPPEVSEIDISVPEPAFEIEVEPLPPLDTASDVEAARPPTEEQVARAREDLLEALRRAGVEARLPGVASESEPSLDPAPVVDAPPDLPSEPESAFGVEPAATSRLYDAAADESGEIPLLAEVAEAGEPTGEHDALADDDDHDHVLRWGAEPPGVGAAREAVPPPDDDDPFLTELRRAVTDTEPLGPREHDDVMAPQGRYDEAVPSARFRRRRGR